MNPKPETRPAKRPKVEDEETDALAALARSDVWYTDGNLVLQAGQTLFRIHKGVLSGHSPVLRDILAVTDASSATIEGCPVVHLEDNAAELQHVLKALYGDSDYFQRDKEMSFVVLVGFLNLGIKYQLPRLRAEAFARLRYTLPSTLEALDAQSRPQIAYQPCLTFDLVALARTQQMSIFLPYLFYVIAEDDGPRIIAHFTREDGSVAILPHDDQVRCLRLKEHILRHQAQFRYKWTDAKSTECSSPDNCEAIRVGVKAQDDKNMAFLRFWSLSSWRGSTKLCPKCKVATITAFDQYRRDFWDKLPNLCDLPPWSELSEGV